MNCEEQDLLKLKSEINRVVAGVGAEGRKELVKEVLEENEEEFDRNFTPRKRGKRGLGKKMKIPAPSDVVVQEARKIRFEEDVWELLYQSGTVSLKFRHRSEVMEFDLTGKLADHLVRFSKVCVWANLPNNPFSSATSASTVKANLRHTWSFVSYLMNNGFLLNVENADPKPLRLLDASHMKALLRERIKDSQPSMHVAGFFRAVARWLHLADYADLPDGFKPGFKISDWSGDKKFAKEVLRYEAERITPWVEIPHDDLMRLLGESQTYIHNFSDDILYLRTQLETVAQLVEGTGYPLAFYSRGPSAEITQRVLGKAYVEDPRSGRPWFAPSMRNSNEAIVAHEPMLLEMQNLIDCCVFQIALWTAARNSELRHMKPNGLFINGERHNPDDPALAAFKLAVGPDGGSGHKFELEFLTFKTTKDKKGTLRKIPFTDDAALSFCILLDFFRKKRQENKNVYLLPSGGLYGPDGSKTGTVSGSYVGGRLKALCTRLGLEPHHPHRCRKTLATIIINKNPNSLELIQKLLGHHSPTMTLRYLMEIPGIAEPIKQHLIETNRQRIVEIMVATATRRISGGAGDAYVEAIPPQELKANVLPATIEEYVQVLLDDPNFVVLATPAAWCMRFPTQLPEKLPCLPDPDLIDVPLSEIAPDPFNCQPWKCGYSVHTRRHLSRAKRNRDSAKRMAGDKRVRAELAPVFAEMAEYWTNVVEHLENGHEGYEDLVPAELVSVGDY